MVAHAVWRFGPRLVCFCLAIFLIVGQVCRSLFNHRSVAERRSCAPPSSGRYPTDTMDSRENKTFFFVVLLFVYDLASFSTRAWHVPGHCCGKTSGLFVVIIRFITLPLCLKSSCQSEWGYFCFFRGESNGAGAELHLSDPRLLLRS